MSASGLGGHSSTQDNYDSQEGVAFNEKVFEHLYFFAALHGSLVGRGRAAWCTVRDLFGVAAKPSLFQFDLQEQNGETLLEGPSAKVGGIEGKG